MKQCLVILSIGLILITTSCKKKPSSDEGFGRDTIPVKVIKLHKKTVSPAFKVSGYFTTDDETPLSFKNGGIIDKIFVEEGDRVKAGQVLATVKGVEVQTSARQAQLNYKKAKRDYERAKALYRDSVTTLEQKQNAKTALKVAKQQKEAARFNQRHSEIRTLNDGVVLKKFLNEGQMAGPGTPVLLINRTGQDRWKFKTSVSDAQWAVLQIGDSAKIHTDFGKKKTLRAEVAKKNEGVDPESGGFTVQLKIKTKTDVPLAAGLFGEATLYPSEKTVAWPIPYDALLNGDSDHGFVFVTNDKKHAEKRRVHVRQLAHDKVVVDQGLENDRFLIISGSAYLKDGALIQIDTPKKPEP